MKFGLKHLIIIVIILAVITFSLAYSLGVFENKGDYIIEDIWIGSNSPQLNISTCDNCLWIKFYEGCNRYMVYFFSEQHEYDERLKIGMPVDIYFQELEDKNYIKHIKPRSKYLSKCN